MTILRGSLAAVAASLLACTPESSALPAFEFVDSNGDGSISEEEGVAVEGLDFASADTDQNGSLSPEEYEAH
jgi:hypothetical protein